MGRDSVAAKARRQAAAAAAAGQGAVAEPQGRTLLGDFFDDDRIGTFLRRNREAREAERSLDRIADTISVYYPQGNLAQESRNVLDATAQLRDAAEQVFIKLTRDPSFTRTPAREQEAKEAIRQLVTGTFGLEQARLKIERIARNRPTGPESTVQAGRSLLSSREMAREALRLFQQANATANLDIRVLRNGIFN